MLTKAQHPAGAGEAGGDGEGGFHLGYRPALDGVRALAVVAVMVYHAAPTHGGGYLGVDVFFVMSGFLITALLVQERQRAGSIGFGGFYARRALRLLPALFVLLGGVAVYALARPRAPETRLVWKDMALTVAYIANWSFALQRDLFEQATRMLSHTWSLGVEEQFYLIWPVVLALALRRRRGRAWALGIAVAGAIGLQLERIVLYRAGAPLPRISFGLDVRAGALMLGVVLGLAVTLFRFSPRRGIARICAISGTVVLLAAFVGDRYGLASIARDPGRQFVEGIVIADVAAALLVLGVLFDPSGPVSWVLSRRPVVWVGKVSYGLYLFHLPIFMIVTPERTHAGDLLTQVVRVALTLAAVTASYYLVERPALRWKRRFDVKRTPARGATVPPRAPASPIVAPSPTASQ